MQFLLFRFRVFFNLERNCYRQQCTQNCSFRYDMKAQKSEILIDFNSILYGNQIIVLYLCMKVKILYSNSKLSCICIVGWKIHSMFIASGRQFEQRQINSFQFICGCDVRLSQSQQLSFNNTEKIPNQSAATTWSASSPSRAIWRRICVPPAKWSPAAWSQLPPVSCCPKRRLSRSQVRRRRRIHSARFCRAAPWASSLDPQVRRNALGRSTAVIAPAGRLRVCHKGKGATSRKSVVKCCVM